MKMGLRKEVEDEDEEYGDGGVYNTETPSLGKLG